jgi:predicted DNA-binding transcriptional regulator AlpA
MGLRRPTSVPPAVLTDDEISSVLPSRHLIEALAALAEAEWLSAPKAAALLGVSSANTIKNWMEGGAFPGAMKTQGGHWRFHRDEVLAVKRAMEERREKSTRGVVVPPDLGDEEPDVPLL